MRLFSEINYPDAKVNLLLANYYSEKFKMSRKERKRYVNLVNFCGENIRYKDDLIELMIEENLLLRKDDSIEISQQGIIRWKYNLMPSEYEMQSSSKFSVLMSIFALIIAYVSLCVVLMSL